MQGPWKKARDRRREWGEAAAAVAPRKKRRGNESDGSVGSAAVDSSPEPLWPVVWCRTHCSPPAPCMICAAAAAALVLRAAGRTSRCFSRHLLLASARALPVSAAATQSPDIMPAAATGLLEPCLRLQPSGRLLRAPPHHPAAPGSSDHGLRHAWSQRASLRTIAAAAVPRPATAAAGTAAPSSSPPAPAAARQVSSSSAASGGGSQATYISGLLIK